jgi:hypothetical protein
MSRKAEKKQNKQSEKVYGEKHRRKWKTKKREREAMSSPFLSLQRQPH